MLRILNACFTNHRNCGTMNLLRFILLTMLQGVWTFLSNKCPNHQCWSSNISSFIDNCAILAASAPCTLVKFIWYKLLLRDAIVITLWFGALTTHSFGLNYTFQPLEKNLLTKLLLRYMKGILKTNFFGYVFH